MAFPDKEFPNSNEEADVAEANAVLEFARLETDLSHLKQQEINLHAAATELNQLGGDEATKEAADLERKAGDIDEIVKNIERIKADPVKRKSAEALNGARNQITQALISSDVALSDAHETEIEVQDEKIEHVVHKQEAAKEAHKEPEKAPCKPKGKKEEKELTAKKVAPKKSAPKIAHSAPKPPADFFQKHLPHRMHSVSAKLDEWDDKYIEPILKSKPVNALLHPIDTTISLSKKAVHAVLPDTWIVAVKQSYNDVTQSATDLKDRFMALWDDDNDDKVAKHATPVHHAAPVKGTAAKAPKELTSKSQKQAEKVHLSPFIGAAKQSSPYDFLSPAPVFLGGMAKTKLAHES